LSKHTINPTSSSEAFEEILRITRHIHNSEEIFKTLSDIYQTTYELFEHIKKNKEIS